MIHTLQKNYSQLQVLGPRGYYEMQRAKSKYAKKVPRCEITGTDKNVDTHHVIPVHVRPDLAADPTNFIRVTSSFDLHLWLLHGGDFRACLEPGKQMELVVAMQAILSSAKKGKPQ